MDKTERKEEKSERSGERYKIPPPSCQLHEREEDRSRSGAVSSETEYLAKRSCATGRTMHVRIRALGHLKPSLSPLPRVTYPP